MALWENHDTGSQLEGRSDRRRVRKRQQRVRMRRAVFLRHLAAGIVGILRFVSHRHKYVLSRPNGFDAGPFSRLGKVCQHGGLAEWSSGCERDPKLHLMISRVEFSSSNHPSLVAGPTTDTIRVVYAAAHTDTSAARL
jgi:hypothetical protein